MIQGLGFTTEMPLLVPVLMNHAEFAQVSEFSNPELSHTNLTLSPRTRIRVEGLGKKDCSICLDFSSVSVPLHNNYHEVACLSTFQQGGDYWPGGLSDNTLIITCAEKV
jgi:hypothetical protein